MKDKLNLGELKQKVMEAIVDKIGDFIEVDVRNCAESPYSEKSVTIEFDNESFDIGVSKMMIAEYANPEYWCKEIADEVAKMLLISIAHEIIQSPFDQNPDIKVEL